MGYNHYTYARLVGNNLIYKQATVAQPVLTFYPTGVAVLDVGSGDYFRLSNGTVASHKFTYGLNVSTIEGGNVTGDDLKLKANTADTRPFVFCYGNGGILADITAGSSFEFANGGSAIANIAVGGGASGGALKLKETTTPTATADYGAIYTKADNHLYWQSGAGVEYDLGGA